MEEIRQEQKERVILIAVAERQEEAEESAGAPAQGEEAGDEAPEAENTGETEEEST